MVDPEVHRRAAELEAAAHLETSLNRAQQLAHRADQIRQRDTVRKASFNFPFPIFRN